MNPTAKPIADPQVILREDFSDWNLLFHPLTGETVGLGESGVFIWKSLDGTHSLAEIAAQIAAECDEAPGTVLEDTLTFVTGLYRRLMVEIKA